MNQELVNKYFPLWNYFGQGQSLRAANLVQRLDLIPVGTYVKKTFMENTIGRTKTIVDPMSNAEDHLLCDILLLKGNILEPGQNRVGHFALLEIIPLLDEEIEKFEKQLVDAGYKF